MGNLMQWWGSVPSGIREKVIAGLIVLVIGGILKGFWKKITALWKRLFSRKRENQHATGGQKIQNTTTGGDVNQAGHNVVTGGTNVEGGGIGTIHGDNVARDKVIHIHRESTPPPASTTSSALHQLPAPPGDFTGREAELRELLSAVKKGGVTISGLQGMGGIGKTALALVLANQLRPRYRDAQFYIDLKGTSATPLAAAEAMAHVIRSYQPDYKPPESEAELSAHYHSVLDGQRAILLMDNAGDAAQVEALIPPATCILLVTSRQHFTLPGLHAKNLEALPPDDARALLLKIASRIGTDAEAIAKLCCYLPLALRLAASAIAERLDLSPQDYAQRLNNAQERLKLVDASLALSYDLLSTELQRQFRALAVFPETFDVGGAAAVWATERDAAHDALSILVKYSLLDWGEARKRYSLHDLVRDFAASKLSDDENIRAKRRHAEHYLTVASAADDLHLKGGDAFLQGLRLFDTEWGNIRAGQAWAAARAAQDDKAARLTSTYPAAGANCLYLRQHPRERILWLEAALAASRRLQDRAAEGRHLGNLGLAYADLGEPRRAIEYYEKVLAIDREIGNRRGEGQDLGNLGNAYADLGEPRRAIEFYEQQLVIVREIGDRRGEGNAHWNMSQALEELGDRAQAIANAEAALKIYEAIENPNAAQVRAALAQWRGQA